MASKLTAFVSALQAAGKAGEVSVLEMDGAAQEVCEEYLTSWLRGRITHNKLQKREIKDDKVYSAVLSYIVALNGAYFYPRLWAESGIRQHIWEPMQSQQELLDFVYRGASVLYARVFGKTTDTQNTSFQALIRHLSDSMCIMSATESTLVGDDIREVFPTYKTLAKMFEDNPWLVFIYYLCRIDLFMLIEKE